MSITGEIASTSPPTVAVAAMDGSVWEKILIILPGVNITVCCYISPTFEPLLIVSL